MLDAAGGGKNEAAVHLLYISPPTNPAEWKARATERERAIQLKRKQEMEEALKKQAEAEVAAAEPMVWAVAVAMNMARSIPTT